MAEKNKKNRDSIDIEGDKDNIEVSNVEDIEVKGEDNTIRVEGEDKDIKIKGDDNIIDIKESVEKEKKPEPLKIQEEKREYAKEKDFKKKTKDVFKILTNKKNVIALLIVLFLVLIYISSSIRISNMDLLEDATTGKKIPLALDPYYFLRIAETKAELGYLPEVDNMRYPSANVAFNQEIHPDLVVWMYKLTKTFNPNVTIRYINILSPVIFFIFGLLAFFFLIYFLTHSKTTAFLSATALAFIPGFLYRTMAGFSDHEAPGILAFFLLLAGFALGMKFLSKKLKNNKRDYYKIACWALLVGFLTAFTIVSWGGIANYAFMIIPLSFFIFWIIKNQDIEKRNIITKQKYILFYVSWIVFTVLSSKFFGYSIANVINRYILSGTGALSAFVLVFLFIDFFVLWIYQNKKSLLPEVLKKNTKSRVFVSILITLFLGLMALFILKGSILDYLSTIFRRFTRPMGVGRLSQTVAENRAPYLGEWLNNAGKIFFWMFFLGMTFFGIKFSKEIIKRKYKWFFILSWLILLFGILFSRISPNHLLNGDNFLSHVIYLGSMLIFAGVIIFIYFKSEININYKQAIIGSWLFFTLISGRGSIRMFFIIMPFICFMSSYFLVESFRFAKKNQEEILSMILWGLFIFALLGYVFSIGMYYQSSSIQAKNTAPSANLQWQKAMSWVRENTQQGDIFTHWWDYGYWIQYLGERPTITDGGHGVGYWDHLIGRYLLTTPKPETALSFMKSHNVSYLLIDPTDLGKYGAYSSIGSGEGKDRNDRTGYLPIMGQDPSQTRETANSTQYIYSGGSMLIEDIYYETNSTDIFLPKGKAGLGAVILEAQEISYSETNKTMKAFVSAKGIYIYNNQQYQIPLRYLYINGKLHDFKKGINATVVIVPRVITGQGYEFQLNPFGSLIYLSPKISDSLFAQLYLMDDPLNKYPTLEIAHKEQDPIIKSLNMNGAGIDDFVVYRGFKGPIKIWEVDYPNNILVKEEFLQTSVPEEGYGSLDDLQFAEK